MSSPIVHAFLPALIVRIFTKDPKYVALAAIAGAMPDIDGIFLLFSSDLFYLFHHEILHPLMVGICFGLLTALLLKKFYKMNFFKSLIVFIFAWALHSFLDVFLSNWYVKLFWPISSAKINYPIVQDFFTLFLINTILAIILLLTSLFVFRGEISKGYLRLKRIDKQYLEKKRKR